MTFLEFLFWFSTGSTASFLMITLLENIWSEGKTSTPFIGLVVSALIMLITSPAVYV